MKNKRLITISIIIYSLLLIPIWGLTLLDAMANEFTVLVSFVFTFFTGWYIAKKVAPNLNKNSKYLILIGPTIYLMVLIIVKVFIQRDPISVFILPILWVFLFSLSAVLLNKKYFKTSGIVVIFLSCFYSYYVFPIFYSYGSSSLSEKTEIKLNETYNLSDFKFINRNLDTVRLISTGKPFLIETWRETCKPCVQSINDLQAFLSKHTAVNQIYVYEQRRKKDFSREMVFNFPKIKHKDRILIDINNDFMDKLGMPGYPYFLLFDKEGELVDYLSGYKPEFKEEYINKFKEMFEAVE